MKAHQKAGSYALEAGLSDGDLSNMRVGKIAVALRSLLPMQGHAPSALAFCRSFLAEVDVAEHPDAVLELVTELLEEIGHVARPKKPKATRRELADWLLADFDDGSAVTRKCIEHAAKKHGGCDEREVAQALRREDDE